VQEKESRSEYSIYRQREAAEAKILIVDDEESVRFLLETLLWRTGYSCTLAADAIEARKFLEKEKVDLVLSDLSMPGESGLDFIHHVSVKYPDMAIIAVTALDDPEIINSVLEIGVYGYIIKPFQPNEILINVANALRHRSLEIENRTYRNELENKVLERTAALSEANSFLKKAQEALQENEAKFRSLFETSRDVIFINSKESYFIAINQSGIDLFGYPYEELLETKIEKLYANPGDRKRFISSIEQKGFVKEYGIDLKKKNGTIINALLTANVRRDKNGDILGYQGIIRDITEQKRGEVELRKAHTEIKRLLASISSILIEVSPEDKVNKWNSVAEKTFGIEATKVVGRPFSECGIQWEWNRVLDSMSACRRKMQNIHLDTIRFRRPDQKEGFLGITLNFIAGEDSKPPGLLFLGLDITENKILEGQLAQAQKLESIGQLAAGIAHEINTPIQYVGDNTRFLQDAFSDIRQLFENYGELLQATKDGSVANDLIQQVESATDEADLTYLMEEIPKAIQQTLEGVERVSKIVRSMKDFSHPGTKEKTSMDINKAIESTVTVARNEWKYVAEMVTDFDHSLPLVSCLPGELNQVFLNMIINAVHAIADVVRDGSQGKGTITINTSQNGPWAEIRISDTGTGIPKEIRSKIFDPFFTTKEVGKGTGQGLAISRSVVVDKHGGKISFDSEIGKGTTFIILLPLDSLAS
jgi:PAS domain S-box-containing protein